MDESVQVWQVPLLVSDEVVARYTKCLSEDEIVRANRFRFEADRRKFVVARGTLRHLLGVRFGCAARAIAFCYSQYGKPETSASLEGFVNFRFNLSHSGELALCVLGGDRIVGIDIEKVKPIRRLDSLLDRCLVAKEKAVVRSWPIEQHPSVFLQHWTCKEAYLKAIGLGLSQSMTTVEVDLGHLRFVHVPYECTKGWQLHKIAVPSAYVAALVVAGESHIAVRHWRHPSC